MTAAGRGNPVGGPEKEALRSLIGTFYPADRDWEPAQYRPVNGLLKRLGISITYIKGRKNTAVNFKAPLSFSYRAMRGEYCVYINPNADPQARMIRDLHEKGHILFNHYQRPRAHRVQFETFFRNNLHSILARLPPERNLLAKLGVYSSYMYNRFSEIAQAMEINSKLFKDDWNAALPYLLRYRFFRELEAPVFTGKDAMELLRKLEDRKFGGAGGAAPPGIPPGPVISPSGAVFEEYLYPKPSWPRGLDWISYMAFLCIEYASFMDALAGSPDRKIRSSDISAYNAGREMEDQIREQHESAVTAFADSGEPPAEDGDPRPGRSAAFTNARISRSVTECDDTYDLLGILRERSRCLRKSRLYTDLLYNANRNKFNAETLIPRRRRDEAWTRNSVCILLDVSGSVPASFVKQVVGIIVRAEGAFDKRRSRLVSWSDSLRDDVPLSALRTVSSGGGTVLGKGIEYCKQYLGENSSFFIISDFQDELCDWLDAAKDIPGGKTAIGYGRVGRDVSFEQWFSALGAGAAYRKRQADPREFCAVFDAVLIRAK
ncbi:MAG: VWA domain-containing protein [Treponema sp.]|nr:VWA domain-containing protein [Treponema sp.]